MFTNWKHECGRALVVLALAVLCAGVAAGLARAEQGGWVDSHGLVWRQPHNWLDLQRYTWDEANQAAANYLVVEDGVIYDDWRLATIDEMLAACDDQTIQRMLLSDYENWGLIGEFWSSNTFVGKKPKGYKGPWQPNRAWCLFLTSWGDGLPHSPQGYAYGVIDEPLTAQIYVLFVRGPVQTLKRR